MTVRIATNPLVIDQGAGKEHSNPHAITAGLCTLIAVILGVLATGAGHLVGLAEQAAK